jgi:hypothetical protein
MILFPMHRHVDLVQMHLLLWCTRATWQFVSWWHHLSMKTIWIPLTLCGKMKQLMMSICNNFVPVVPSNPSCHCPWCVIPPASSR